MQRVIFVAFGLLASAVFAAPDESKLHFDIDLDHGYAAGDAFDSTGEAVVNQLSAKPEGERPYRKFTDMRSKLGKTEGKWKAMVQEAAGPFDSAYLRFEVGAGQTLAGRFELFAPPSGQKRNHDIWFAEFDYARLTEGKGGNELLVLEMKNRWGEIIGAPAMWYHAWLGDWQNTASNRGFEPGRKHRVRYEVDFATDRYAIIFDGETIESGQVKNASEFGGVSFVFAGRKSDEARAFGFDNIRIGWMASPAAKAEAETAKQPAMQAHRAADFLDAMGINVVVYDDHRHESITVPRLAELGIKHLRVGLRKAEMKDYRGDGRVMLQNIRDLGDRGYTITGIWNCWHTMDELADVCESLLPDALHQVEGPNEPWHGNENFRWQGQRWPIGPRLYMADMYATVRSHPALTHLPILSFSGSTTAYGSIEHLMDYGNEHIYPDAGKAITTDDALAKKIERCRVTNYPTLPLQFTECGYNSGGENGGFQAASLSMQTRGTPRLFLEAYRHGLKRLYLYCLLARHDVGFSLVENDGAPKPAFDALRDMIQLLRDGGANHQWFDPDRPRIAIHSPTPTVHHLLLQKSNGELWLCLWNDVDGWNPETKQDIVNPDVPVTVELEEEQAAVSLYRPVTHGIKPLEPRPATGTTLTLMVPDHPLLVRMGGNLGD